MRGWTIGLLFALPALTLAQEQVTPGDASRSNAADSALDNQAGAPPTLVEPLTPKQKLKRRSMRLIEPVTLFSSAFGAGFGQLINRPPEWGQGAQGFALRFVSSEGSNAAHNAISLGFDVAFHLDSRYRRMPQAAFKPRVLNAVKQTFIAHKDGGGSMLNVSEIAGNFGAGFITGTWQPPEYNTVGNAIMRGALGMGYDTLKNLVREFLPDLLHPSRRSTLYTDARP
jgi:hypothetical protein